MARPLGMKHTEADKIKMRKPHKRISEEECKKRSDRRKLYMEARKAFVAQYVKVKDKDNHPT